jgi:hypothetical protein
MARELEPEDLSKFHWEKPEPLEEPNPVKPERPPDPTGQELTQETSTYHPRTNVYSYLKDVIGDELGFFLIIGIPISLCIGTIIDSINASPENKREQTLNDIQTKVQGRIPQKSILWDNLLN